jgi:hypothetical protein
LNKIKALVEGSGARLILLTAPFALEKTKYGEYKSFYEYARSIAIDTVDLNVRYEELDFDNEKDFYDAGHLNVFGAEKATRYIGQWLVDHYDFNTNLTAEIRARWDADMKQYDKIRWKVIEAANKSKKTP